MIKYNSNTINDWYYNSSDIIKVYHNGAVCYYKIAENGSYKVCFAVVDNITQYHETEFEDVFDKATEKWYKLNNLNQYEEYGVYASGRTSCEGSSRLPQGYTEVEYIRNSNYNAYINTGVIPFDNVSNTYTITTRLTSEFHSNLGCATIINCEELQHPWTGFGYRYKCSSTVDKIEFNGTTSNYTHSVVDNGDETRTVTIQYSSNVGRTTDVPVQFFACWDGNYTTAYRYADATIYSSTIVKNGVTVRDFVPAMRNSDSKYGLYDLITDTFYTSPNGNDFSGGSAVTPTDCVTTYEGKLTIDDGYEYIYSGNSWVNVGEVSGSSRLPVGYTEVEYIENTSSAYIDLNVYPYSSTTNSYEIETKISSTQGASQFEYLFSCEQGDVSPWYGCVLRWQTTTPIGLLMGSNPDNTTKSIIDNGDGTSAITLSCTQTEGSNTTPVTLWCGKSGDTVWRNGKGKFYTFKLTVNSSLIRDLVPCKRDSDDKYGLYDIVNDVFYISPNNVDFSGGDEISPIEYPIYYDEMQDPPNNLVFSSMTEAETYAYNNCVYDGLRATIDGELYTFDSEEGWVEIPYYYKFEDVTPSSASGWTITESQTYNPDSTYYDDYSLENITTSNVSKIAKITIFGYESFTYYIRSFGYRTYAYVTSSNVDEIQTDPTTHIGYNSTSAITNTYYFNKNAGSSVNLSNYRRITYNNLDKNVEHTFYVTFYGRSYSRYYANATILIPKEQTNENWEQVTFTSSSNVSGNPKNLYVDGNYSSSGGTQYFCYRWMLGLPSGSHSSNVSYSNYNYCPNVTSSTFTSVAGNSRLVEYSYNGTTNKTLQFRLVDESGNTINTADTVYYSMTYYNSCGASSSSSNLTFPRGISVKVGGRFSFTNSSNRHYIYGYEPNIQLNTSYYSDNYETYFDIPYTKLSTEAVTVTYVTYDPNDVEVPAFSTKISYPYGNSGTTTNTLTSYDVPYTYTYDVAQTNNKFSADSQSFTASGASRTVTFTLYPNNRDFSTVADLEAYQYAWEGMRATVGDTKYKYTNGEWVEQTSKDSDFVIGDFNTFVSSSTEVTEGYYIIYSYAYDSSYANKNYLFSWNSGNTWNGYYTLGNMNHTDTNNSVPISSSEIIDDAVWELKDAGNGNFYVRNVGTNKYWYYLGTHTNYGVPLTDNASEAIPVNIQDYRSCLAFVEKQSGSNHPINKLYAYTYRYGWYANLSTDGNNQYYMRKYQP